MRVLATLALCLSFAAIARAVPHFPSVEEADASLKKGEIDDVYLAFASIKPKVHPDGDRKVAAMLVRGSDLAITKADWALATGFASKARELDPKSLEACLAEARAAEAMQNRTELGEALDAALAIAP